VNADERVAAMGAGTAAGHDERGREHMTSGFIVGKGPREVRYMRGVRRLIATGLALLGGLALLARPAHADVASSPARRTAARSAISLDLSVSPSINVQLYKGKRGTMLVVHGGVAVFNPAGA
jgi:hypothetical protein